MTGRSTVKTVVGTVETVVRTVFGIHELMNHISQYMIDPRALYIVCGKTGDIITEYVREILIPLDHPWDDYSEFIWHLVRKLCYFPAGCSRYYAPTINKNQARFVKYVMLKMWRLSEQTYLHLRKCIYRYLPAPRFGFQSDIPFYHNMPDNVQCDLFSPADMYCSGLKSFEQDMADWRMNSDWTFRWPDTLLLTLG
jgi:hypothetical protein